MDELTQAASRTFQIAASEDDAEIDENGIIISDSENLLLTFNPQLEKSVSVGLRYVNVGIPAGAFIAHAALKFKVSSCIILEASAQFSRLLVIQSDH